MNTFLRGFFFLLALGFFVIPVALVAGLLLWLLLGLIIFAVFGEPGVGSSGFVGGLAVLVATVVAFAVSIKTGISLGRLAHNWLDW